MYTLFFQCCFESNFTNFRLLCNPARREQTCTSETGPNFLVSSWFGQSDTLDEFRHDFYIINFRKLWTFSNVSWHTQLKLFQLQTSYQLIEIKMIVHSNKNDTHNIQEIKIYYAHQAIKHNLIQQSKGQGIWLESSISRTCSQCAQSTARTI